MHGSRQMDCNEEEILDTGNPFALPCPPSSSASRLDPKVPEAQRRNSIGVLHDLPLQTRPTSSAPLLTVVGQVPSSSTLSKVLEDIPTAEHFGRPLMPQGYSTSFVRTDRRSLFRPRSLVMPPSLATANRTSVPPGYVPEGFKLGEKPLPPESRTSIRTIGDGRPRLPLSLSHRTFRGSLIVGDVREDEADFIGKSADMAEGDGVYDEGLMRDTGRRPGTLYVSCRQEIPYCFRVR